MTRDDLEGMQVTSTEGTVVGSVRSVFWADDSGTQVIGVETPDHHDFVIAVKPTVVGSLLRTSYTVEKITTGPTVNQFTELIRDKGRTAAVRRVVEQFDVVLAQTEDETGPAFRVTGDSAQAMSAPPPGPPNAPRPPWFERSAPPPGPANTPKPPWYKRLWKRARSDDSGDQD